MQGPPVGKSTLRLVTQRTPLITICRSVGVQWHYEGITPIYWCDEKRRLFAFSFHHCLWSASSTSTSFLIPILPSSPSPPGICYPATSKPIQGWALRLTHGNERVRALLFPVCGSSSSFIPAMSSNSALSTWCSPSCFKTYSGSGLEASTWIQRGASPFVSNLWLILVSLTHYAIAPNYALSTQ